MYWELSIIKYMCMEVLVGEWKNECVVEKNKCICGIR